MTVTRRTRGAAFMAAGLAVGGYFLVFGLYVEQGDDRIWGVLNWIMAVAAVPLAFGAHAVGQALPADADAWERLPAIARTHGSQIALPMLLIAWLFIFVRLAQGDGGAIPFEWIVVNTGFAILTVNAGLRLWREPGPKG